jgi:hypothetical protein
MQLWQGLAHGERYDAAISRLAATLPCNDLDASEAFYNRPGFTRFDTAHKYDAHRIFSDGMGGNLPSLTPLEDGSFWVGIILIFISIRKMSTPRQ